MKREIIHKQFASEEEYFLFEEKSELKHELYNGNLIKKDGTSIEHHEIATTFLILLKTLLKGTDYRVFFESVKVKNPLGNFFYPDVMVCNPNPQKYYSTEPVVIIEVLSESTRKYDLVDKFIQYQKIETLQYYLCIEPEKQAVIFYTKDSDGEWQAVTLTTNEEVIALSKLSLTISLQSIFIIPINETSYRKFLLLN